MRQEHAADIYNAILDIKVKRVGKAKKICRKYLNHVQKSVFDGAITEEQLKRLKNELQQLVVSEEDTVCIYYLASSKYAGKEQTGTVLKSTNII